MTAAPTTPYDALPTRSEIIARGDPRLATYNHDSVMTGDPDAVVRPANAQECQEILRYCHAHRLPITLCGSRTSMTGSSVAESGLLLSLERIQGVIDIHQDRGHAVARVRPGTIVGELQRAVAQAGWCYPPSPTSRHEATIGATIATNATGDNTYKYGTTRRYVRALEVLLADGSRRCIDRPATERITELKNTAGYFLSGSEIDYFIGSEGTLGLITEITVDLITQPHPQFGLLVFFPSRTAALQAIARAHHEACVSPSAMEYIDDHALRIMATHPEFPDRPAHAAAAIIIYQEFAEEARDPLMQQWFSLLANMAPEMPALLDHTIVAQTPEAQEQLRRWRHHIPMQVAEQHRALALTGGGKVGSDWWVPIVQMPAMMAFMYERSETLGIPYLAFGHLGNGHPHVNYLTRTPEEKQRAQALVRDCCREAVRRGGGVAGEHGLGKIKRDLLTIQHPPAVIQQMHALKQHYDPHWILGRGNILVAPT